MQRIGILTFHRGPNYGGFMQAWHMREAVRSFGHQATLVNYQHARHHAAERIRLGGISPGHLKGLLLHTLKTLPFRPHVGELSDHPFTTDPEQIAWREFDRIVVGSDVVWNHTDRTHGNDPVFFGSHPAQGATPFMAYAPSCGDTDPDAPLPDYVRHGLNRFSSIQVRDQATAKLVQNATGTEPPLVVDPTWLQPDPVKPCSKIPRGLDYVLVYGQGATGQRAQALRQYCNQHRLKVVSATFKCEAADYLLHSIDPIEWVDLFRNARAVVTSTLHGLLYSIKYRKPTLFMVRGPSRSKSRLVIERCGMTHREVEEQDGFSADLLATLLDPDNSTAAPQAWIDESRERFRAGVEQPTQS